MTLKALHANNQTQTTPSKNPQSSLYLNHNNPNSTSQPNPHNPSRKENSNYHIYNTNPIISTSLVLTHQLKISPFQDTLSPFFDPLTESEIMFDHVRFVLQPMGYNKMNFCIGFLSIMTYPFDIYCRNGQ